MPFKDAEKQKREQASWYQRNKRRLIEAQAKRRAEFRRRVYDYKKTQKCELCPESDPICLDFHHRDPATKEYEISEAAQKNISFERVLVEIQKCAVLCANCHRKQHRDEHGLNTMLVSDSTITASRGPDSGEPSR